MIMNMVESIRNEPEKWKAYEYWLMHDCGAKLWTASGKAYCQPYNGGHYGPFMRRKAWRAYTWWTENVPVEQLGSKR